MERKEENTHNTQMFTVQRGNFQHLHLQCDNAHAPEYLFRLLRYIFLYLVQLVIFLFGLLYKAHASLKL